MGNPKQKWTSEEEEALRAGVAKHGTGKWKDIQRDPEFNPFLSSRSNIDLKDKWRNLSVSANGQGPREKSRTPKTKLNQEVPAAPSSIAQTPTATPVAHDAVADQNMDDSSKSFMDGKNALRYNEMIFEALSTSKEPNGLETGKIVSFIEQRHEVPQNFRRLLSTRLRRLVAQDKLEKVQNCYKMKSDASSGTPTAKASDTVEEAAEAAAYKIAEAENKSFMAAEAVKEAERISEMADNTDSLLQLAKEIFEQCSRGEIVLMAPPD